jgi:formate-nitrite transporter family protein
MKNVPLLFGTITLSLLLVVGIAFFFSGNPSTGSSSHGAAADTVSQENIPKILGDARNVQGPEDAQITIVEFSDLQCPACRAVHPLIKQVTDKYPDDVRFVYRHYPLSNIHPYAQLAAEAAEVAAESDLFFEFHDKVFEQQPTWSKLGSQDQVRDTFIEYASDLGIDSQAFRERMKSGETRKLVLQDTADGTAVNISGTPTLFVNNQRVSAPHQLMATVESLLEKEE